MRDAFGGVFMMRLLLVFITILVAFGAISFKYAKSFRVKNKLIDFVEQNQVKDIELFFADGNGRNDNKLQRILAAAEYNNSCDYFGVNNGFVVNERTKNVFGYCKNGALIIKNMDKSTKDITYYNIYTYVSWDLGILNKLLVLGGKAENSEGVIKGKWLIAGEAIVQ